MMKKIILMISLFGMIQCTGGNKKALNAAIFKKYLVSRDEALAKNIIHSKDNLYSFYCEAMLSDDSLKRIALLTQFIKQKPAIGLGEAYMNLCKDCSLAMQTQKTLEMCTKTAEIDSKQYYAYYFRADAYTKLENYEAALEDYARVIAIKPDFALAYLAQGNAFMLSKQYEKAEWALKKAIQLNKPPTESMVLLGVLHFKMEQYQKAIDDWEAVLKIDKADEFEVATLIQKAKEKRMVNK